jgi:hypothetical protein
MNRRLLTVPAVQFAGAATTIPYVRLAGTGRSQPCPPTRYGDITFPNGPWGCHPPLRPGGRPVPDGADTGLPSVNIYRQAAGEIREKLTQKHIDNRLLHLVIKWEFGLVV